ncbi:MAG TPA: YciI family protein [Chlamydiales bacterium]|nr:YciI family protein [Chlamydiales bacterium]
MNMLIAVLTYVCPLEEVNALLSMHREFLQKNFEQGKFLVCGRLCPRTGGVIIAKNITYKEFEKLLREDPFSKVSEYKIIEFTPSMYDDCLKEVLTSRK